MRLISQLPTRSIEDGKLLKRCVRTGSGSDRISKRRGIIRASGATPFPRGYVLIKARLHDPVATAPGSDTLLILQGSSLKRNQCSINGAFEN
jgi:hypothetical protein